MLMKKTFQVGRTLNSVLGHLLCLEGEMTKHVIINQLRTEAHGLMNGQGLQKYTIGKSVRKGNLGENIYV
jgi:hypothetical protein